MVKNTGFTIARTLTLFFLLISIFCAFSGCSTTFYKKSADKEVYTIIDKKSEVIEGMPLEFTIEATTKFCREDILCSETLLLSLVDSIEMAVKNSREYQSRKERLYLEALSLTSARHAFDPIFAGSMEGTFERNAKLNSISGVFSAGVSRMLETGGDISISMVTNLFKYINVADPQKSAASAISGTLVQPLLRGAGRKVALENLTQSERDMVYAIRDFIRYRRSFSVSIAQDYYTLLQRRDEVANALQNYESLQRDRERAELMAKAGRLPEFEVDQARQNELTARDRWQTAVQRYRDSLDNFKITLGIPIETLLEPDPTELENLALRGIVPLQFDTDKAIQTALEKRLDLATTEDRVYDAERRIAVAKNALLPGLDLILRYDNSTKQERIPLKFNDEEDVYSATLGLDLPLDQTDERNAYRQALIVLDVVQRNLEESIDLVKLEVRNAFRRLEQAEQAYQIQKLSLTLAERRVESTTLLHQAGRASTRDLLDAQQSLLDAQNAITNALVNHNNALLDLLLATETLIIDDNGLWQEVSNSAQ